MKILLITPYYEPDLGPSAPMLTMLSQDLVRKGHAVTVLCSVPHFPSGRVDKKYRKGLNQWSLEHGVKICRIRVPSGNRNQLRHRLLVFIIYQLLATLIGSRQSFDVALITNPAVETGLPFCILCWLRRKPCIFAVWDLYPEVGIQLGIFRGRVIIGLVKALEDVCLRHATYVQALAEGFMPNLRARVDSPERVLYIPPWLDTDSIYPLPRKNSFSLENGLDNSFVVLYAGNIGYSQGLEQIIIAAQHLEIDPTIKFVFVGDGPARLKLISLVAQQRLTNVVFLPFQPRERISEVLSTGDITLVSLLSGIGFGSLPSKTFSNMASGRVILAITDENNDLWRLIQSSKSGMCVPPGSPEKIIDAILSLKNDRRKMGEMGACGRVYVVNCHSRQAAVNSFEAAFMLSLGKPPI